MSADERRSLKIQVRAFASLRQALGAATLTLDLAPGATVAHLLERLGQDYPAAAPIASSALVAVNQDYAGRAQVLIPGDEVAVFSPGQRRH